MSLLVWQNGDLKTDIFRELTKTFSFIITLIFSVILNINMF